MELYKHLFVNPDNTFVKEALETSSGNRRFHEEPGKRLANLPTFKSNKRQNQNSNQDPSASKGEVRFSIQFALPLTKFTDETEYLNHKALIEFMT